jgi:hypothetical protein
MPIRNGVDQAIERPLSLAALKLCWMEEPTNPDDSQGHARIRRALASVRIATGEHCHNSVMLKQLLQAEATIRISARVRLGRAGRRDSTCPVLEAHGTIRRAAVLARKVGSTSADGTVNLGGRKTQGLDNGLLSHG